ncbi:type VI secretion system membrane subunit TssM (plasmid) [Paracoccus sp. TK19116]|uniref:Type VI secretion system membrane subunit TssM n=1 Tax=Paracoccus albicereus TaxID=2922394 RepID=A0ABT1MM85_9RHOB|nr:type VI secretion system membrane subunit TssM [Paracoccus albicereus]MCQ0969402.1 type VI secretion system membrane subunit TssM [Paracoccus albicereus]
MRLFGLPLPRLRNRNNPWMRVLLTTLGIVALIAAIWFGLPMTGWSRVAGVAPRLVLISGVLAITLAIVLWRWRQRVRAARAIEAALIPEAPVGDGAELAQRMEQALATLKKSGGAAYLYDLPWYVIIGPPGAGKTTALANSGLDFPLTKPEAVAGFGGTRYADFWFAEEAVLIDTAGRYTTQDSQAEADKASWQAFLDLLKKSRPNQPINGVLLAFPVDLLMEGDESALAHHADTVRARLAELHEVLKVDFPVYVLFTKADLIAGFREYFASFSLNRRKVVWGTTFQTEDRKADTHEAVPAEFDRLVARLSDEVIDRLSEEPDGISRIAIFGLPGQMSLLRDNVAGFLRRIFEPTRYKSNAILRGFYFTSGTQEGTPVDQVLGALNPVGAAQGFQPAFMSGRGKSFFLHDLLRRVIFAEQGWVSLDRKAVRRSQIIRAASFAAIGIVGLGLLSAFGISYWKNATLVRTAAADTQAYARIGVDEIDREIVTDPDLSTVLPLLDRLRGMPAGYGDSERTTKSETFGLSQRERMRRAATDAYSDALERMLRPRMILDLEQAMPQIIADGDTTRVYRALKVYLLLGGEGESKDDEAIGAWFAESWRNSYPGRTGVDMRERLAAHLAAMLRLDDTRNLLVEIDQATVDAARAALAQLPLDDQAYAILREGVAASGLPDWSLAEATAPNGAMVLETRDGAELASQTVPAMFTYEGFWSYFYPELEVVGERLRADQWVLGDMADRAEIDERLARLDRDLLDRYRADFKAAWDRVLTNLTLNALAGDPPRYEVLGAAASASASPILMLVKAVDDQTRLTREFEGLDGLTPDSLAGNGGGGGAEGAAGDVGQAVLGRVRSRSSGVQRILMDAAANNTKVGSRVTGGSAEADSVTRPIELIAEDFARWHDILRGEPGERPVDTLLGNLGALWENLRLAESNPDQSAAVLPTLLNSLTQYNSQLPEPLAGLVNEAEADFQKGATDASVEQMNRALADRITFFCRENITSAYPFRRSGRSLSIDNFARFFGPGGDMDAFFTEYLDPLVERTENGLVWRSDQEITQQLSSGTLLQFQRAEAIRQAFFASGGTTPEVSITVAQVDAHPSIESALLAINDALVPTVTGSMPRTITWPGTGTSTLLQLSPALDRQSAIRFDGSPWTLIDFLGSASARSQNGDVLRATFTIGGRSITYDFTINAVKNPFTMAELREFECPQSLD